MSSVDTVTQWLARLHGHPGEALAGWTEQGVALVPMDERLCAAQLRGDLVHAAAGTEVASDVATVLAERIEGPVICDRRRAPAYYALMDGASAAQWDMDEVPCLGAGVYLGVPAAGRAEPPGPYWVVPPRYAGHLCCPSAVRAFAVAGMDRLRRARGTVTCACSPRAAKGQAARLAQRRAGPAGGSR